MQRLVSTALVQINSTGDYDRNLRVAERMIRQAADTGARLVLLPELFNRIGQFEKLVAGAETIPGPTTEALGNLARELQLVLCGGSICEKSDDPRRAYNTSLLFEADGELVATYRKLHLFDVAIPDRVSVTESHYILPGDQVITVATSLGQLGMATCYDLRFPELFRLLAAAGAEMICLPSAFTKFTGQHHWHTLVKARAIENQCFLLAANQVGQHRSHLHSYGHSLIVDPWGQYWQKAMPNGKDSCSQRCSNNDCWRLETSCPRCNIERL